MPASPELVLDTNVVLDLLVFADPAVQGLHQALLDGRRRWLASAPMRSELDRVLAYPRIRAQCVARQRTALAVLAQFDRLACIQPIAKPALVRCRDPDDQCFVDLAVAHGATLLSRDDALLEMAKRLTKLGVQARTATGFVA